MKRHILLVLGFVAALAVQALPVTKEQAAKNVRAFLMGSSNKKFSSGNLKITYVDTGNTPYYIYNIGDNKGFVIASGDNATYQILAYSYEGSFDKDNVPVNMQKWLDGYEKDIRNVQNLNIQPRQVIKETATDGRQYIPALVTTKWNQGDPYNRQCPDYGDGVGHRVTGCVATAMAQVMYYHGYPENATTEIPGYSYEDPVDQGGDGTLRELSELPSTTFKWNLMQDVYDENSSAESCDAVAELMSYCGRSVMMSYGVNASGAQSENLAPALTDYFGYSAWARIIYRDDYATQEEWEDIMYDELAHRRPILYAGATDVSGHQFICDGYDEGFFHINWGWGGSSDGFFKLNVLDPNNQGIGGSTPGSSYTNGQSAVIGIMKRGGSDRLYSENISTAKGVDVSSDIDLFSYKENYTSLQFDIELPSGINISENPEGNVEVSFLANRSEKGDHTLNVNKVSEGLYRVVVYSPSNSRITGKNGAIVNVRFNTTETPVGLYNIKIKNIKTCDVNLVTQNMRDISFSVDVRDEDYEEIGWYNFFRMDYDNYTTIGFTSLPTHYDCAVRISPTSLDNLLKGKMIRACQFAFKDVAYINNVKIWMSHSLPSVPEKADITCQNVEKSLLKSFLEDGNRNIVYFDESYQMMNRDVYVGYSFDITYKTSAEDYPIVVVGNSTSAYGMFLSDGASWTSFDGSEYGNLGLAVLFDDNAPYIMGDVNYDDEVNVADATIVINSILNKNTSYFNNRASDVNKNGEVNIVDVASISDIILERYKAPETVMAPENNDAVSVCVAQNGVDVMLSGENFYKAMQMDVVLPEGEDILDVISDDNISTTHRLEYTEVADNRYRIVAYSLSGRDFAKTTTRLFRINTCVQDVTLENIIFVTSDLREKRFANVTKPDVTGIIEISEEKAGNDIYTIDGRKLNQSVVNLSEGVYIINGKKVIIK